MKTKILIIGGAGYVGTYLTEKLIKLGYFVTVYDLFIYGDNFIENNNLKKIKGDIRDINLLKKIIPGQDKIIHLACISNDPSFDLDPNLGKEINFDVFEPLVLVAKQNNIKNFIYASSSSVYGIKEEKDTNENSILNPLTDYSKFKAMCEKILLKHVSNKFAVTILRPATVCGYSKRQRFDLVVNILSNHAYNNKKITVLGGDQLRPNIHIDDMANAYLHVLESSNDKINNEIFNVGFENKSVTDLAKIVKDVFGQDILIDTLETNDNRSYHITSEKIRKKLNFNTQKTIKNAVEDLKEAFDKNLFINPTENEMYFNIKRMKSINLK